MSTEDRLQRIEKELHRVRRVNRWLSILLLAALGGTVAGVTYQRNDASPIRTTELRLVDERGDTRCLLCVLPRGPVLAMHDSKGEARCSLSLEKNGASLLMGYANGKPGCQLTASEQDGPRLLLFDSSGKIRCALAPYKDEPSLLIRDSNGETRCRIGAGQTGTGGSSVKYPESSIQLFGPDGFSMWRAP